MTASSDSNGGQRTVDPRERSDGRVVPAALAHDKHDCPAAYCGRRVSDDQLMCGPHWHMVPEALRRAVWRAWSNGDGYGSPAHRNAIDSATRAVNRQLEGTEQQLGLAIGEP